ncbi:MAG: TMEM165/GDT1 family protein [Candidatus Binatia bacterium]|nr:TMEM165/GDT1 family protein [Candidatus Binatia bacterium]
MKGILVVFVSIFLAELGDKTQVATLLFATDRSLSRLGVFVASSAALVCSSLIAVLGGEQLARWVSPNVLKLAAGIGFIVIGIWLLADVRT